MNINLTGKVALITGTARIGAVVAETLAKHGVVVSLGYRSSRGAADEAIKRIVAAGGRAIAVQGDLTRPAEAKAVVDETVATLGRLDILVNMASVYKSQPFDKLTAVAWDEQMAADARSAYLTSIAAAPHLKKSGGGRIINMADWLAASGRPNYPHFVPYYTAKKAIIGLTEALALELAPDILVNAIAPGPILPPPDMSPAEIQKVERATPLGRWGGPDEIAKAVLFFIESEFVTGEVLRVDGGRHLR